jgi:hypothetical protein
MSITDAKSAQGGETLPSDLPITSTTLTIRPTSPSWCEASSSLSEPENVTEDDQEEFGHRINGGIPLGAAYLVGHHDH